MSDSTYVEVMYELIQQKNRPGVDSTQQAAQRRQTLARHRITAEDLEKKALVLSDDPVRLAELWAQIQVRLGPGGGAP
jgi:hypothetical protein